MIDTVVLSVPIEQTMFLDIQSAGVEKWDLQSRTPAYEKYVRNPSARDRASGLYFPKLTGFRRKDNTVVWRKNIKIEFSAPKLIYQNNLDELADDQFEEVVDALHDRLSRMGIVVLKKHLSQASVTAVHYSKNVELKNGYTSQFVIGELNKINLNKRFDLTRARFMNDGQSLYAYSQAHSFVIYDKVADLVRGKKRSIDREQTQYQLNLFESLRSIAEPAEIIRFEVRLSQKRKLNLVFKKLAFKENPTFADVFSAMQSKEVLWHYWDTMLDKNGVVLFGHAPTTKDLFKQILLTDRKMKAKEAIYLTGLIWLLREGNGMRELRTALSKHANDRTWYRIAKDAMEAGKELSKLRPREWHEQVCAELSSYQPYRISM